MARLTDDEINALDEWARTQPHLRKAFTYTKGSDVDHHGLGHRLAEHSQFDEAVVSAGGFYSLAFGEVAYKSDVAPGAIDHGTLAGLADDDHPQYARKAADWNTFRQGITAQGFYLNSGTNIYQGLVYTEFESSLPVSLTNGLHIHEQVADPATPAADGAVVWAADNQGETVLKFKDVDGITYQILQDQYLIVRNTTGSPITKGQAVYVNGTTGTTPTVALAKADSATTLPCLGLANQTIADNAYGHIIIQGVISSINTATLTAGQRVWVSGTTAGGLTTTRPAYPVLQQSMGVVLSSGVGNGSIFIIGSVDDLTHIETVKAGPNTAVDPQALNFNGAHFYLTGDSLGQPVVNLKREHIVKSLTIQAPTNRDTVTWWIEQESVTVTGLEAALRANDSAFYPYVKFTIRHGTYPPSRGSGTELTTGGWVAGYYLGGPSYATENPVQRTTFDSPTINAGEYIWLEVLKLGENNGYEEELHVTVKLK